MMKSINIKKSKKITLIEKNGIFFVKGPLGLLNISNSLNKLHTNRFFLNEEKLNFFLNELKTSFYSVQNGWFVELNLKGLGYKCFKISNKFALDIGLSNLITFEPNKNVTIKSFKNKLILFSMNRLDLNNLIFNLKKYSPIDPYKGKGLFLKNEVIKLKNKKV